MNFKHSLEMRDREVLAEMIHSNDFAFLSSWKCKRRPISKFGHENRRIGQWLFILNQSVIAFSVGMRFIYTHII